jgi:hypothetical protein
MNEIKVGGREVIFQGTILMPSGEDAWIRVVHGTEMIVFRLTLGIGLNENGDEDVDAAASIRVHGEDGHGVLTFGNCSGRVLTSTEPMNVGRLDGGEQMYMLFDFSSCHGAG